MKKTINAGIGGRSFTLDEDAYNRLDAYLKLFKARLKDVPATEVMDDIETRIAELFTEKVGSGGRVVDITLVEEVINQLGMPDGSEVPGGAGASGKQDNGLAEGYQVVAAQPCLAAICVKECPVEKAEQSVFVGKIYEQYAHVGQKHYVGRQDGEML